MATVLENDLVSKNLGLVKEIVRQFRPPNRTEYDEYVQVGTIGLLKAIRKHDPARGALSTIAWRHIKWEIIRYIKKSKRGNQKIESIDNHSESISYSEFNMLDIVPDNLSELEQKILQMRIEGYKINDIILATGLDKYRLSKIYKSIVRRIKDEKNPVL